MVYEACSGHSWDHSPYNTGTLYWCFAPCSGIESLKIKLVKCELRANHPPSLTILNVRQQVMVPRSRTRWECDVKASGNDRVIWRVPLHRKSNIIEWVLRLDDFLKQTGSKAILSPRRASGRLVLGWLWSSEGKGQDGFDVHQVWPFVTVSSTGPNRLEFVLVFRESVPRGLYA